MVWKLPDMFHKDLLGIPAKQHVKFIIDLISGVDSQDIISNCISKDS